MKLYVGNVDKSFKSVKGYEIVAGERRCKASKIAGLTTVPAIIKDFTDEEMMEIALLENIQREDLNPVDTAISISNILQVKDMTQEEFSKKFGKSRSYITNLLGLLNLPKSVQELVKNGKLSMSHARCLSKIDDEEKVMNKSLIDINGSILSVSQFTLYADSKKGNRPSYKKALESNEAKKLYEKFNDEFRKLHVKIETGIFGADMQVSLINDGPVSIILEKENKNGEK